MNTTPFDYWAPQPSSLRRFTLCCRALKTPLNFRNVSASWPWGYNAARSLHTRRDRRPHRGSPEVHRLCSAAQTRGGMFVADDVVAPVLETQAAHRRRPASVSNPSRLAWLQLELAGNVYAHVWQQAMSGL